MSSRARQGCGALSHFIASWVKSFLKATPKICLPISSGPEKPNSAAAVSRCYSILPFNSCWTPLSTVCTSRTSVMHRRVPSWWQVSSVLQIFISFLLLFKPHSVSWVDPVFWMPSHFLNTSANSTKSVKGLSAHLWRNPGLTRTSWLLLLCQRCICPCFPLFALVFKAALYCVLLHLMGNFKRLHTAMLFLTLTLQLW